MTLDQAIKKNPFNPNKGNKSAYCRYLRYNVEGWYNLDSKEVLRRWESGVMNMSIDESLKMIKDGRIVGLAIRGNNDDDTKFNQENIEALNTIVKTIYKYQKIEQIVRETPNNSWIGEKIRKVLEE